MRTHGNVGKRSYKFAVVNNAVVDKPHHVTLEKQKWDGRWDAWGGVLDLCMCGVVHCCKWRHCMKRERRIGSGPFNWKGRPNSQDFQANQRGLGWTLIGWSEGRERSIKGCRGHCSLAQITCPSSLWMTYPCKVNRRGVINVSVLNAFCFGETNTAFTQNRHSSSGQDRN